MRNASLAPGFPVDVERLLETRLLVQAASGFGKSWALRRLLEQTAPVVQQLIIDPEGEFSTLREKFDYVICAPHDGDAVASPRTAALLARRLLETGVSAILNIYDLKAYDRHAFVDKFLVELVNAPKRLWHPVLIVLDEAHVFAPEGGKAQSTGAVIDLATRGRKRGQGLCVATQRLAKLHKDVAAEMLNKMIGRCGIDIDVRRAADEIGYSPKILTENFKTFNPGDFYIFGPALTPSVERIKIGDVATTHPRAGARLLEAPPAPSSKIKGVLAALADLPQQAESEIHTLEDAQRELANLRRKLTVAEKAKPRETVPITAAEIDGYVNKGAANASRQHTKTIARLRAALETLMKFVIEINAKDFAAHVDMDASEIATAISLAVDRATKMIDTKLEARNRDISALQKQGRRIADQVRKLVENDDVTVAVSVTHNEPFTVSAEAPRAPRVPHTPRANGRKSELPEDMGGPERRILDALAWWESVGVAQPEHAAVAAMARYSVTSSSYGVPRSRITKAGLAESRDGCIWLTDAGREVATFPEGVPSGEELRQRVLQRIDGPHRRLLEPLIAAYPGSLSDDELAAQANYSRTSSSYGVPRSQLKTFGLIHYPERGRVAARSILFP